MLVLSKIAEARATNAFQVDAWLEQHWVTPQYRRTSAEHNDNTRWEVIACDWVNQPAQSLDDRFFYTVIEVKEDLNLLPSLELIVERNLANEAEVFEYPIVVHRDRWYWPYVPPFEKQAEQGLYCYVMNKELMLTHSWRAPSQVLWFSNDENNDLYSAPERDKAQQQQQSGIFDLFRHFRAR